MLCRPGDLAALIFRGFRTAEALRKCPSFISVYRPLSLQPIESCSKGLENGDHCGRGFRATFNENIFGFELGAFRVENFRERTYATVETDCGRVCGVLAGLRRLSAPRHLWSPAVERPERTFFPPPP